jgi:hypothetical protein
MKALLPWLCVVGLAIGLGVVYSAGQKKDAELAALREESQQLQKLRAELEDTKNVRTQAQSDELVRLRKDNEDLLRLRNEVSQLRKEKQQLATQVQTAEAQAQALHANLTQTPVPGQPTLPAQPAATVRPGVTPQTSEQQQAAVCINNLRLIDGAKQQWALEKQKPAGALLIAADLTPYLKTNVLPTCPAGGVYTINPVGYAPICSIPGHALGK